MTALGVALYIAGSFLNTGSELQRKRWKERPENKGRLFTGGFFRYALHINYFGDEVLFAGYALITGQAWALLVPLLMAANAIELAEAWMPTLPSTTEYGVALPSPASEPPTPANTVGLPVRLNSQPSPPLIVAPSVVETVEWSAVNPETATSTPARSKATVPERCSPCLL